MRVAHYVLSAAAMASVFGVASAAQAADCRSFAGKPLNARGVVVEATEVSAPMVMASLGGGGGANGVAVKTPFCRVRGVLRPTEDSNINFEVWLPSPESWNGRYQGVGNGGFAGQISYGPMERALRSGFAVSATDTGHAANGGEFLWAVGHPERVADMGWRAIHETAVASKDIVAAYYAKPAAYSYFVGCSRGGGAGLMSAQRFPNDYDGILAGAPGADFNGLLLSAVHTQYAALAEPGSWISAPLLTLVTRKAVEVCGGRNGFIDDPSTCRFDPVVLQCKPQQTAECLTPAQVTTLRRIYAGPTDRSGKVLVPGFAPGGEASWARWIMGPEDRKVIGSGNYNNAVGYFRTWIYNKSDWDVRNFDAADALKIGREKIGPPVDAINPDLAAFKARGGKLIVYHGWNDAAIPSGLSPLYYDAVAEKMGGVAQTQSFYRLFMAPGMEHCAGGPGPSDISGAANLASATRDPEKDAFLSLINWVEKGAAPGRLVASKFQDNDSAKGVVAERPWCVYPATARYDGRGDPNRATSYNCVPPKRS